MSQENVEIVRRATEAFNREGAEGLVGYCDPEIEWRTTGRFADGHVYRGHDGVRRLFAEFGDDMASLHSRVEAIYDAGERVVSVTRLTGAGRRSAAPIDLSLCYVIRVADGRIVEVQNVLDRDEALEAVGLRD